MAERNLSPEVIALISAGKVEPEVFMVADFPSGTRRFWTGLGTYTEPTTEATQWEGIGGVVEIETIEETVDTAMPGLKVSLNGLDSDIVNSILSEAYQGQRAEITLGFWDRTLGEVIFLDEPAWKGTLDTDESNISGKKTDLTIFCEHRMVDILRKREYRYTAQDQKTLYPDIEDTGFQYMEAIQDVTVPWGRTQL